MYASTSTSRASASIRRAPSRASSSSAERTSPFASSLCSTILSIGVPFPARQGRSGWLVPTREGTPLSVHADPQHPVISHRAHLRDKKRLLVRVRGCLRPWRGLSPDPYLS